MLLRVEVGANNILLVGLDNLVEGKRKRRNLGSPSTSNNTTPTRKGPESPQTPHRLQSGKRKLVVSEEERSPAKRGRRATPTKPGQTVLCLLVLHLFSLDQTFPSWSPPAFPPKPEELELSSCTRRTEAPLPLPERNSRLRLLTCYQEAATGL